PDELLVRVQHHTEVADRSVLPRPVELLVVEEARQGVRGGAAPRLLVGGGPHRVGDRRRRGDTADVRERGDRPVTERLRDRVRVDPDDAIGAGHRVRQEFGRVDRRRQFGADPLELDVDGVGRGVEVEAADAERPEDPIPAARWRSTPRWGGRYGRGSSQLTPPWADSATGPSLGTSATTVAPREVAVSTAAARSGSPASSPETSTTSSAPTHAGSRAATTSGGTAGPPTDAASAAATAADCRARAERPVTHTIA